MVSIKSPTATEEDDYNKQRVAKWRRSLGRGTSNCSGRAKTFDNRNYIENFWKEKNPADLELSVKPHPTLLKNWFYSSSHQHVIYPGKIQIYL